MAGRRKNLLPRRRRHDDEGEEDGSTIGDADRYASSEASLESGLDNDVDVSVDSDADNTTSAASPAQTRLQPFATSADTHAMLNGIQVPEGETVEELDFDDTVARSASADVPKRPAAQRTRSAQNQHTKQRASIRTPTEPRKHALHDNRNISPVGQYVNSRGRGRGHAGTSARANFNQPTQDVPKQWQHDLHETINKPATPVQPAPVQKLTTQPKHAHSSPNRSFSTTTVLGNVSVNIYLPGTDKMTAKTMIKKHYTLLPQHRPPLRRDKPVRISIPDEHPRYIFPSTERSFIFIPRAMRPNQQQHKGRGRGSFYGSRRPSIYGGSTYTPSIGMSRRPSIAASLTGSGYHTPDAAMGQYPLGMQKPVVRMPLPAVNTFAPTPQNAEVYLGDNSAIIHSPSTTLPMHQPTPQKTVSLDQIESPTVSAPLQGPQQPFHQQIPQELHPQSANMPHIPEGAVYAQPFMPFPMMQAAYYPQFLGTATAEGYNYAAMNAAGQGTEAYQQAGPVAHESNGMVYYYDPSQQYVPMGMVPGGYYYPPMQNQMYQG